MEQKRKISYRKILQTLFTLVLLCCCVMALSSASRYQDNKKVKLININIENTNYSKFVQTENILNKIFKNNNIDPTKLNIGNIDLNQMEQNINTEPWVASSTIYIDNRKNLNVTVIQKIPYARIFDRSGNSYYLDTSGKELPLSESYNHYEIPFFNVPILKDDSISNLLKSKILNISYYIKHDSFWLAQTSGVIVNSTNDIEIIPILGNHRIILGNAENISEKLDNVFLFYKNVLSKIGWNKYQIIDTRFKNQIVTSPSLPYKANVDRAMTNMNWVKSIVGNAKVDSSITKNATYNVKSEETINQSKN